MTPGEKYFEERKAFYNRMTAGELTGSDKQVKWAKDIRAKFAKCILDREDFGLDMDNREEMTQMFREWAEKVAAETSAKKWIEFNYAGYEDLIDAAIDAIVDGEPLPEPVI